MPIGSDANIPLNTDPSLVPAQPAVSQVNLGTGGYNPRAQPLVPLSQMPPQPGAPVMGPAMPPGGLPAQPQGGPLGGLWGLLARLFGGGGQGAQTPVQGPPQGMRGLLQQPQPMGQRRPGVDTLGNPLGRF